MALEANLEDCIWGRSDWNAYTEELVGANRVDEGALIERIDVVKGNICRQIRKAVEQHHPRLVEQASALQNLDRVQAAISREMTHLYGTCEQLSERFQFEYEKLRGTTNKLEQLYAVRRILSSASRCEQLVRKLESTNELVKRSEMICELEAITAEVPSLKDLDSMRQMVLVTIPRLAAEARQSISNQLKSSLESLNAPLVSSCVRALSNLSSYESEVKRLLEENVKRLDGQFLQLSASTGVAAKHLPQLASQIQMSLEQYSLLSVEIVTQFCEKLAKVVSRRIPENASYAARFVQLLSKILSVYPAKAVQPLDQSLRPLRRAILSQSLSKMFKAVDSAFEENNLVNSPVEKIDTAIREEIGAVEWDAQLKTEMESNVAKVLQFVAQKIEQRLVLDSTTLQMGERLSSAQTQNYAAISVAQMLSLCWPAHGEPLTRISQQAQEAVMEVARSSVFTIMVSMHDEQLNEPSPYVKELCNYLRVFQLHAPSFLKFAGSEEILSLFVDYVIELFLMNSSLLRPLSSDQLTHLSSDLQFIVQHGLASYNVQSSLIPLVPQFVEAFKLPAEKMAESKSLPFWFVVQLLISMSEETLLSPHVSAGWTLQEYLKWFQDHGATDRLNFLSSLMRSYTSSVISHGRTEYVANYPLIMNVLQRVITKS